MTSNVKAMVIAAGIGSRLSPYTDTLPKCMLDFNGKTLLQRQVDAFHANGIENISVIRGYKKEKININGLRYYENPDFKKNNILNSLFYGEAELDGPIIISYSDILFDSSVVHQALTSEYDISIVVDTAWQEYYVGRIDHPISEAENVVFNENGNVKDIGKNLMGNSSVDGEFIGMIKFSEHGANIFKAHFHRAKKIYWNKPFQQASTFQKAYLTDLIKAMVDQGVIIHCVQIEKGWKEIDTVEDYQKAIAALKR